MYGIFIQYTHTNVFNMYNCMYVLASHLSLNKRKKQNKCKFIKFHAIAVIVYNNIL